MLDTRMETSFRKGKGMKRQSGIDRVIDEWVLITFISAVAILSNILVKLQGGELELKHIGNAIIYSFVAYFVLLIIFILIKGIYLLLRKNYRKLIRLYSKI